MKNLVILKKILALSTYLLNKYFTACAVFQAFYLGASHSSVGKIASKQTKATLSSWSFHSTGRLSREGFHVHGSFFSPFHYGLHSFSFLGVS